MSVIIQSGYSPTPELTHARIGYESIAYWKTPTASSAASGYPAIAATYPTTYEYWQPTAVPATWAIDNAVPVDCDFVGLVGDFNGGTVDVQYSDDGISWTTQVSGQITGRVTMFLFESVTARYWRIQVTNQIPSVSVVYIGKALAMQRRIYQGHSPLTLSRNTELTNNISEGGQYLGRSIVRQGVATDAAWAHLKADWYRSNFDPFVQSARTMPFFFAWRPSQFPQELGFVWTDGDVQPTNSGPKDYMSVSLNMRGIYNTSRLLLPGSYDFRPSQVLTASRSTTATYIDDAGVLQTAGVDVPRYQGGQLLVEGEATNQIKNSSDVAGVSWSRINCAVTANAGASLSGVTDADKLIPNTTATSHYVDQLVTGAYSDGEKLTFSIDVQAAGYNRCALQTYYATNGGSGRSCTFNLSDGTKVEGAGVVGRIEFPRPGIARCEITVTVDNAALEPSRILCRVYCINNAGQAIYAGDGTSGILLSDAQLEKGDKASSRIKTTTSAATRAADIITVAA